MRKAIVEAREQAERERKARELAEKRLQIAVERISRLLSMAQWLQSGRPLRKH